jgi:hypothetical protein
LFWDFKNVFANNFISLFQHINNAY